jgi:hypothetical protein
MSIETFQDYVYLSHALLPILLRYLRTSPDRQATLRALEVTAKICGVRENYDYLVNCPDDFLEALVDLLCVSFTSIEPLHIGKESEKPIPSIGPFNDCLDADIRNCAIEALNALCVNVPPLRSRIARVPHCMRILQRIVQLSDRRELSSKMPSLLIHLSMHGDNLSKFLAMQDSVFVASSYDDSFVGQSIALKTHILYVFFAILLLP